MTEESHGDAPRKASFHDVSLAAVPDPVMTAKRVHSEENGSKTGTTIIQSTNTYSYITTEIDDKITPKGYAIITILFTINLLNYMDRLTISAVLTDVTAYYNLSSSQGGLLQTVFIVFFMAVAPICGYLGDRYNRKWIMVAGLVIWIAAVLASTFVPRNLFYLFLFLRGVVGTGEASYSVIAPTVIADMFKATVRSRVLMVFYLAIPLGSGLGYIIGSNVASAMGAWQWGLRVTPIFGALCVVVLAVFVEEPEREVLEKIQDEDAGNIIEDCWYLLKNKTYVFSTWGYTFVIFTVGTLSWWAPSTIEYAKAASANLSSTSELSPEDQNSIGTIFGGITLISGLVGVITGTLVATMWKKGSFCFRNCQSRRADIFVCIFGSAIAVPFLYVALLTIGGVMTLSYVFIFITVTALSLNWACNVDLLMYIVPPRKRNIASAVQTSVGHAFGDASGPWIVGQIADWAAAGDTTPQAKFDSLKLAFWLPNVLLILSVVMYTLSAFTLRSDLGKLQKLDVVKYEKNSDTINTKKMTSAVGDSTKNHFKSQEY
ncbi:unnamed protein product [Bursaphelenchus okinawaensis]|uniref:Major facilitator superfamily (MFS) profile domain-containing protein n=1 Tax=Bursaphelenchus okinawaensis TaxID=465554 RepID=A0A811L759_9BILA|nr:unnamed protein product [Bursaphelenchus okinawaensis]CAG9118169.1 unnamed protein product [Bursaphelenchus okinawaensis]